ncbi:hypothetical protein K7X08_016771 [Anisodus acutangulus]|uniref:DUF295 domain-containing protein n=1 Tax=Anisodus acutangulus TaxID=402998 RepID=A0A9Q1LTK3_9SOLA|nr:hypothetical protein K7X08_016771 [Anisodus acutangulus]
MNISGGHINPAVTFGGFLGGHITLCRSVLYWIAQLFGSVVACLLLKYSVVGVKISPLAPAPCSAVVFEIVTTFGLVYTVYATSIDPKRSNSGMIIAPIAIGFIVGANILSGGAFYGAAMNPAAIFGQAMVSWTWTNHWVYWLGEKGSVDIWDFNQDCQPTGPIKFTKSRKYYPIELFSDTLYIVLSSDDILLVVRHIGEFVTEDGRAIHEGECDDSICPYRTVKFDVYKMDLNREEWLEVKSLNDRILFLGGNQSFSVLAKDHPGYKANSIYFTDDYWDRIDEDYMYGGHDMGVFSLQDGCVKQFCEIGLQKIEPPPFWVFPDW